MTKYNGTIPNLLQGVSQQPRKDRRAEQLEVQINSKSQIEKGLGKRPGSMLTTDCVTIPDFPTAAKHAYDRGDGTERYTIICTATAYYVLDMLTGSLRTVAGDVEYLQDFTGLGLDPKGYLSFYTIADTTFVVNNTREPFMRDAEVADDWQAILHCAKASYGFVYKVVVDDITISTYTAPSLVTVSATEQDKTTGLRTFEIMDQLWDNGLSAWIATEGIVASRSAEGSVLVMTKGTSDGYKFEAYDDNNNNDLKVVGFSTTQYDDLPLKCKDGYKVQITGKDDTSDNDYYVEFIRDVNTSAEVNEDEEVITTAYDESFSDFDASDTLRIVTENYTLPEVAVPLGVEKVSASLFMRSQPSYDDPALTPEINRVTAQIEGWNGSTWLTGAVVTRLNATAWTNLSPTFNHQTPITKFRIKLTFYVYRTEDIAWGYYTVSHTVTVPPVLASDISKGYWSETLGFNLSKGLDPYTMPHKITRQEDDSFLFERNEWIDRGAGDENSNPTPSFVGNQIEDLFLYGERMVFLSDENAVASQVYDHFNLFSESVIKAADDDPIDTASSDNQVTKLKYGLIFNSSLMIFSDKAQFLHPQDIPFTSGKFALASKTRYNMDIQARPVATAHSVFFGTRFGNFTGVREFRIEDITGTAKATPITGHVKKYVSGRILQLLASTDADTLVLRSDADLHDLFIYNWFDQDNERKQASWSTWTFPFEILHADIIQHILYLWFQSDTDEMSVMELDLVDEDSMHVGFPVRLDNMTEITAEDVTVDNVDYWKLSRTLVNFQTDDWADVVVVGAENSGVEGASVSWEPDDADTYILVEQASLPNSVGTPTFFVGLKYDSTNTITNPYVRDHLGRGKTHNRTIYTTMKFNCYQTGYLQVEVAKKFSDTYTQVYSSKVIDSSDYLLNSAAPLLDKQIKVPIVSDADLCTITFKSDSHLPFYVQDVDWEGTYHETGRTTS